MLNVMRQTCWPTYKRYLRRSSAPVLVGPWRGEVGFETLYWLPFLRALGLQKARVIPITRGGAHLWYDAEQHVELYDLRDPRDVRVENIYQQKQTGQLKQIRVTDFDRAVIRDAAATLGLRRYSVLHPAWMYQTLEPYWRGDKGLLWLMRRIHAQPLPPVEADGVKLPPEYVAVRFYYRYTFPPSDVTNTLAVETVKRLAKDQSVIVLNANVHADEHVDVPIPDDIPNVIQLKNQPIVTAQNNLALQSAILSKAMGFVGTYGGLAQLATSYRKPTVSFYTDWAGTALAHKYLADAVALSYGVACHVLRVTDAALLHAVVPNLTFTKAGSSGGRTESPVFAGPDVRSPALHG